MHLPLSVTSLRSGWTITLLFVPSLLGIINLRWGKINSYRPKWPKTKITFVILPIADSPHTAKPNTSAATLTLCIFFRNTLDLFVQIFEWRYNFKNVLTICKTMYYKYKRILRNVLWYYLGR